MSKKAVVYGGLGFIGHNLVKLLINRGYEVLVFDAYKNYTPRDIYFARKNHISDVKVIATEVEQLDDQDLWELQEFNPDVAYHLANFPNNKLVYQYPYEALYNFSSGLYNVISQCAKANVKNFVYVSSSMVYGDFVTDPQSELNAKKPKGLYGIHKRAAELTVKDICDKQDIDWRIVRPSAVYGPLDNFDRVAGKFLHKAVNNQDLNVKGEDMLDFTYVTDTAMGIMLAGTQSIVEDHRTFNITRGKARSIKELAEIVVDVVGKGKVVVQDRDDSYPYRGRLDISEAKHYLGYNPEIDLEEGIEKYYKWYKDFYK